MNADVLVTGANGYLGRQLLSSLFECDVRAAALVRRPSEWPAAWVDEVGEPLLVEGSPMQPESWLKTIAVNTIVHTAGMVHHSRVTPHEMVQFNVESTLQMVRAAHAMGARLVFVSSSGTVGCYRHGDVFADEHAPFAEAVVGRWPYYASKIRAEREGARLAEKLGVPFTVVRLPVLLGPRDHRFRSTGHVARVLDGRVPFIPSGGMHFTDVRDVASAMVRLTQVSKPRSVYHFPGTQQTLGEFFDSVSQVSGVRVTERQAPAALLHSVAAVTERLALLKVKAPHWVPDPVVLEMAACHWGLSSLWTHKELAYNVRKPLQTLSDTVAWLRAQKRGGSHAQRHA